MRDHQRIWTAFLPDGRVWAYGWQIKPEVTTREALEFAVSTEWDQPACVGWLLWSLTPKLPGLWSHDPFGMVTDFNRKVMEAKTDDGSV